METTQIHSVAGKLGTGTSLIAQRPFRSPHHTISEVALVGGGSTPQPGEITLAHNGVLFCDELPEFSKTTLEVLRQPLEDRKITISRAKYTIEYPCNFMFIASMNPCPCGYYGDPTHTCVCTPGQIQRYMNKISGPLLDRIDIQCEITPVPFKDISRTKPGEPSADIRQRVLKARAIQTERFQKHKGIYCNAQMTERMIHQYAEPNQDGVEMLRVAMVGGGSTPQPGEITLAHNGVLFCDELPEFSKTTLEVLRQPLEDRKITISRAKYTIEYPCNFMFIASMNPCPCGYYGDPTHTCVCTPGQIQRYMNKISGPLLDRIDIQCEITPVPFKDISRTKPGEPSADIRQRVLKARAIQTERFQKHKGIYCNAQMTERMIHQYAEPNQDGVEMLRVAMERMSLSARAYSRILKVARTIADLSASPEVLTEHLAEAISYRNLDRGDWAER